MSNKHYRTPANPPMAQRAVQAALSGKTAFQPRSNEQMLDQLKQYLSAVVAVAQDSLEGADTLVSVREGLQAARSLISVMKHEQRLKERAEKAAAAAPAKPAPTKPSAREVAELESVMKEVAQVLVDKDPQLAAVLTPRENRVAAPPEPVAA